MDRKKKYNIDVKVVFDTREVDISYVSQIKIDKRRLKDGIKFIGTERETCRPSSEQNVSYGDITFKYKFEDEEEWQQANFCIERKGGLDQFSSIYIKKNYDRLLAEFDRAVKNETKMYYVVTDDTTSINSKICKVRKFSENQCKIFFDKTLKLKQELKKRDIEMIVSGNNIGWVIRRLIKKFIKESKINYK